MNVFFYILIFYVPVSFAQDLVSLLAEEGPVSVIELDQTYSPRSALNRAAGQTSTHLSGANLQHTIKRGPRAYNIGGRYQHLELDRRNDLLRDYTSLQASLGYRQRMDEGKFWSLMGSFGSSSDRPFRKSHDNIINANYLQKFNDQWFGVLNYSNNRSFLNNVPLPGFFWVKEMNRERGLILGFPFVYWMAPVSENWSFRYTGFVPWNHRLKILFKKYPFVKPYFGYEQGPQSFFRHDREERQERFFWFERRLGAGVESGLSRDIRFDLFLGQAFDRVFFEDRNFNQHAKDAYRLDNSFFAAFNMRYAF